MAGPSRARTTPAPGGCPVGGLTVVVCGTPSGFGSPGGRGQVDDEPGSDAVVRVVRSAT